MLHTKGKKSCKVYQPLVGKLNYKTANIVYCMFRKVKIPYLINAR